uniref:FISUMP domain-containing protein n=1 Tax=uncultured Draconibacterium sp. TaxID=1573823 RepID=UPI003216A250
MNKYIWLLSFGLVLVFCNSCNEEEPIDEHLIKDGSGNTYTEIVIGNQVWLKEDLRTDKYLDGSLISTWNYENKDKEGFYYSSSVDFDRICPEGYGVPTKSDFKELIEYFGGDDLEHEQMIEAYVNTWHGNPNGNGDGILNTGSGLYWTSTKDYKYGGNYYFYFRTKTTGIPLSVTTSLQGSFQGTLHIKCIKKRFIQ